jgi:hypothetical protein
MSGPNYLPKVPTVLQSFADWQPLFLDNFAALSNAFGVNHVPLEATSNAGNHTIIQLLQQKSSQQTNVAEIAVYAKDVVGQTDQIFFKYQQNGQEFQFSNYQIYPITSTVTQISYFTFLPGGYIVYFGQVNPRAPNIIQPNDKLFLQPAICTNIISVNLTPVNVSTISFATSVTLEQVGDYFTGIYLKYNLSQPNFKRFSMYYMVVGQIKLEKTP